MSMDRVGKKVKERTGIMINLRKQLLLPIRQLPGIDRGVEQ
jgi:hypothetical protein